MRAARRARCAATRSTRRATSVPAGTAATSTDLTEAGGKPAAILDQLRTGEPEVLGRLVGSSNNAMVVRVWPAGSVLAPPGMATDEIVIGPDDLLAVWKPTLGERPLFDFPIGTLSRREVAAYRVSEELGWGIVPPTILRDGPYGEGMLQQWINADPEADVVAMVNDDDPRLRLVAVFDAIINNTDRKAGHLLPVPSGHLYAVDHGVTFSEVPKLRTVLWAWEAEPLDAEELAGLRRVRDGLGGRRRRGPLAEDLAALVAPDEIEATRARVADLLSAGRFPSPNPDWPAIPWPPY